MGVKYKYLFIVFLSLMPLTIRAQCTDSRRAELNKIASNVKFNYSYNVSQDRDVQFSIIISNVTPDIYVVDNRGNQYRNFENIISSQSTEFEIYSSDSNCNEMILTRSLSLPTYNTFSKLDECNNNTSYLCNIWYDTGYYDQRDFIQALKNEKKGKQSNISKNDSKVNSFNMYVFIIPGLVIIGLVVAIIIFIKKKG
ncbi:MAG: hypothetical protein IKE90_03165 [Bacilli bacterium]|nr:hypothetical protein [Bacilli bacterium]